ncbi:hypothetical protein [Staphylococcus hsinchuensis]|uniref:Uncharacterized protein n=1 Tax=Staphylococcus hsinchuensis TaxID=3051183 RepID=A0ABZ3EGA5_9STAP
MKITDKTKNYIANDSYDDIKVGEPISTYNQGDFQVIEKRDNTTNGLRAYAFAPVVNGKPDTSQIVIGYAGTDALSLNDLKTDTKLPIYHDYNIKNIIIDKEYKN